MTEPSQSHYFRSSVKTEAFSGQQPFIKKEVPQMHIPSTQCMDHLDMEKPKSQLAQGSEATEFEEGEDVTYLTGEYQFFDVMLAKTHVMSPYQLQLPAKIVGTLPRAIVPVIIRSRGKNWDMLYFGHSKCPRFCPKWGDFVRENDLKVGDACVFELKENCSTKIKFRVIILKNELPPELNEKIYSLGTPDKPIHID